MGLALWAAGCDCGEILCGLGNEDSDLVGAERALGDVRLGAARLSLNAELSGRYVRVRGGGGRMSYACTTDDERWTIRVRSTAGAPHGTEAVTLGGNRWSTLQGRAAAADVLAEARIEQCAAAEGEGVVYRVQGIPESRWQVAYALPGAHLVTGPLDLFDTPDAGETGARTDTEATETCAVAAARAVAWSGYAARVYGWSAVRGWANRSRRQAAVGEEPEVPMPPNAALDSDAAADVCHVLWAMGDASSVRQAMRCLWSQAAPPNDALRAAITEGESHRLDVEALLYAELDAVASSADLAMSLADLGDGASPAAQQRLIEHGLGQVIGAYLSASQTATRQRAFADAALRAEGAPPAWRLRAAATLAAALDDNELCELTWSRAASWASTGRATLGGDVPTSVVIGRSVLALVQPTLNTPSCGDDERRRAVMERALLLSTRTETHGLRCSRRSFEGDATGGDGCVSLPVVAGEWLARHCTAETVGWATRVAHEHPPDRSEARFSPVFDGAARVLAACDEAALRAVLEALPAELRGGWSRHLGVSLRRPDGVDLGAAPVAPAQGDPEAPTNP